VDIDDAFEHYDAAAGECAPTRTAPRGRAAASNPTGRFERLIVEDDWEAEPDPDDASDSSSPPTRFYRDTSKSIITFHDSPDLSFSASLNPYRGCEHGCIYCYARPYHEFLGLSAGLDFESTIFVKEDAPELLRKTLSKKSWQPQVVHLCGVTDPYQPFERNFQITRKCLEVLLEFKNPVSLITKNGLITRDLDLLSEFAKWNGVSVAVSITTLDEPLRRKLEPRASSAEKRLEALRRLSDAGVPTAAMVAPLFPGLTDHELIPILERAKEVGITHAGYTVLRLPWGVKELVADWLNEHAPGSKQKVLSRVSEMQGKNMSGKGFKSRMRGEGVFADQIRFVFESACSRLEIPKRRPKLSTAHFRVPSAQKTLF